MSDCTYPEIPQQINDIITGGLMGDATVGRSSKNPRIQYKMINKKYLESLDKMFGEFSTGVRLLMTAKEKSEEDRLSGFNKSAKEENYSDVYQLYTICHPDIIQYKRWYATGEKVFPNSISLNSEVLKHWYSCDGSIDSGSIEFGISNEISQEEKLCKYFSNSGLPEPNSFKKTKRADGSINCVMRFTVSDSKKLLDYMGEPTSGFEYKWKYNERQS